jgi:hypothetical protein
MSKPVARTVLSVLICLAILAGIYMTVYGAAFRAGASSGRIQVTAGLMPDLSHYRIQASTASGYYTGLVQQEKQLKVHDCDFNSSSSLDD